MDRAATIERLDAAQAQLRRLMGGVDPAGAVEAARLVMRLRMQLVDDASMIKHFGEVYDSRPVQK